MLTLGLLNDLVCLLLGGIDELIATLQNEAPNSLATNGLDPESDGITFVDQTTATEGNDCPQEEHPPADPDDRGQPGERRSSPG